MAEEKLIMATAAAYLVVLEMGVQCYECLVSQVFENSSIILRFVLVNVQLTELVLPVTCAGFFLRRIG